MQHLVVMLRSEIVTPIHSHTIRLIWVALGAAAIGAAVTWFAAPAAIEPSMPTAVFVSEEVLAPVPQPIVTAIEEPPPAPVSDVKLVFRAGDAPYMKLGAADARQQRGKLTLFDRGELDDYRSSSVGVVAQADLPPAHHHWIGRKVIVDGACEANIVGFAVVARLTGSVGYADGDDRAWSAKNVYAHGAPVLAARLDNCEKGTFARDAALAPIVVPSVIEDKALAKRARAKLLASTPSQRAQLDWETAEHTGDWHATDGFVESTIIVQHPTTHVTYVSTHAKLDHGCGGVEINLWGLYRVEGEQLVSVQQRALGDLFSIDRIIDLEGDGELEVIGKPWLGTDTIVARAGGDEVTRLELPFYGCPC